MLGNVGSMAKMAQAYYQTQKRLKSIKGAGQSKDLTVSVLLDGRFKVVKIEVNSAIEGKTAKQIESSITEAFTEAREAVESLLSDPANANELKKMLGV